LDDRREARAEGGRRFQREGAMTAKDIHIHACRQAGRHTDRHRQTGRQTGRYTQKLKQETL